MRKALAAIAGLVALAAQQPPAWTVARSAHFEVYSQASGEKARNALVWFEQLRAFVERNGMKLPEGAPVRVIGFRSVREYEAYRLRPTADAYYIGIEKRDYIVMPALGVNEFPIAAHEYAHVVLHASGLDVPLWAEEGLAEYFSTIRIGPRGCQIGGKIPRHEQILRERRRLPVEQVMSMMADSPALQNRQTAEMFYAESWELVNQMLGSGPLPAIVLRHIESDASVLSADKVQSLLADLREAMTLRTTKSAKWTQDDSRYQRALEESNRGHYEEAVTLLRAMQNVRPARAYSYWSALAYALGELKRREEAKGAAAQALRYATTDEERARARQLAYIAETDLNVQFTRTANGELQLVTTRVPHGSEDWNPFIEPGDAIRREDGMLQSVECGAGKVTGMTVETAGGSLRLSIPDPLHVLMKNAPAEFTCGRQNPSRVRVEYAGSNNGRILRGMEFVSSRSAEEVDDQGNHGEHDQQVNEPSGHVHRRPRDEPNDQQNEKEY